MRGRSLALGATAMLIAGAGSHTHLEPLVQQALAPAYDASTQANLRHLGVALQSVALVQGDLTGVTPSGLEGWGWVPGEHIDLVVHVDGDRFWAVGQDVRPGAGAFTVTNGDGGHVRVSPLPTPQVDAQVAGVRFVRGATGGR
ncbi:hypothetical protein [Cellulomonas bogoriensis]|uniref:Uncharacterized protein n=1 Tax=Cellulomonas bogoriensis 69B4 = DSM 16987 TaxID=1386082 RepID=A0A0A0BYJ6_9CELL|nr:hypothetical protein [Cellulomonas bogoriensis]KGM13483.1 hypothetical protein N869_13740 [Cellulomonas bogoriensis 69B4 = DSM 16987]